MHNRCVRGDDAGMLDDYALADIEGDACALRRHAGMDDGERPRIVDLCVAIQGHPPLITMQHERARLRRVDGIMRVALRRGLPPPIARYLVGHELGHVHHDRIGYEGEDIEERCDAFAAALIAPWEFARAVIRARGHSVRQLADALRVPQALALLRLGEVTGRPVLLIRTPPIARGAPYVWPRPGEAPREVSHPVRLADEGRWGLMGSREL